MSKRKRKTKTRRTRRPLGAVDTRHAQLSTYHAKEAERMADNATELVRTGKCVKAMEALLQAATEYGRADGHASTSGGGGSEKKNARGAIAAAESRVMGCVVRR
jgi:hypothetical protein